MGHPDRWRAQLAYCDAPSFNPAAGGIATHVYAANGLYDPDVSGVGTQPYGFDQLIAFYNHYAVLASSIEVFPVSSAAPDHFYGVVLSGSSTLIGTTVSDIMEMDGVVMANAQSHFFAGKTAKARADVRTFYRVTDVPAKDSLCGDASNNPTDVLYWHVVDAAYSGDPVALNYVIKIVYEVEFFEPKELARS